MSDEDEGMMDEEMAEEDEEKTDDEDEEEMIEKFDRVGLTSIYKLL